MLAAVTLALLAGCTGFGGSSGNIPVEERSTRYGRAPDPVRQPPTAAPAPGVVVSPLENRKTAAWQPLDAPRQPTPQGEPARPPDSGLNPAVVNLLNKANRAERSGDLVQSAAHLERALRIQPDSAWLWHRLALVRLFQKQPGEAVSTARKSNALAAGNAQLQADNWRVIAQAEEQRGNVAAADAAASRSRQLYRQ